MRGGGGEDGVVEGLLYEVFSRDSQYFLPLYPSMP